MVAAVAAMSAASAGGAPLSTKWGVFDGSAYGDADGAAPSLHAASGDFWYASLVKGTSGILWALQHTDNSGPFVRVGANGALARYWLRRSNFTTGADEDTVTDVFDDTERLVIWQSLDEGVNAGLYSWVDGDVAVTYHGADTEGRQGQAPWPPNLLTLGGTNGAGSFVGKMGFFAAGQGAPLSSFAAIQSAYSAGGRRALPAALATAAGSNPAIAIVIDGQSDPAFGDAPVWTGITYADP